MVLAQIESFQLRPASIASRRFSVTGRGYNREEVDQYLEDVADYLSRLQGELEWRRARRRPERGTIIERQEAVNVVAAAREQAEKILADARKEAQGYVRLARAIANQLAMESQSRKRYIALALAEGESNGDSNRGEAFEDLEVWMDAALFEAFAQAKPKKDEQGSDPEIASEPESEPQPQLQ